MLFLQYQFAPGATARAKVRLCVADNGEESCAKFSLSHCQCNISSLNMKFSIRFRCIDRLK